MNRLKTLFLCTLLAMAGKVAAQTVGMSVNDVTIDAGGTAELTVSLENPMTIAGWQLYLYLPDGVTIAYDEEDGERYYDETVVLSSRHLRSHTCTVTETADGGYLIMAYNPSKPTAIKESSGEIVTITLQAADSFTGEHTATIKNVAVSDMSSVQTNMEGEVTVHITEFTTGIPNTKSATDDGAAYDLSGRRMALPSKGVNIIGGNKVVVR